MAKLGYAGVNLFFLILPQNIDCGYSLATRVPTIYGLSKYKKNVMNFSTENFQFLQLRKNEHLTWPYSRYVRARRLILLSVSYIELVFKR